MRTDLKHIEEALLTPIPKHIEEAQRLAAETESAIIAILSPEMGSNEIYAQILKHIPLATLLAAQEKLEKLGSRVDKLFEAHKQWTLAVSDERNQLRAERDEWKKSYNTVKDWAHRLEAQFETLIAECDGNACGSEDSTPLEKFANRLIGLASEISLGKVRTLRTRETALLAAARAAKAYIESDPRYLSATETYSNMCNALAALEPGIKV